LGNDLVLDWYEGQCPQTGERLRFPRTALSEAIARGLMARLDDRFEREGKMYGVLLVETTTGERAVLQAFSGLLHGLAMVPGWVPPIPGRQQIYWEEVRTLSRLDALKQQLIRLQTLPERQQLRDRAQVFTDRLARLTEQHRHRKQARHQQRQFLLNRPESRDRAIALAELDQQSRADGRERRQVIQERDAALQPLQATIAQADAEIQQLKQQRKALSRQLQAQMHRVYQLTNFAGESRSLQEFVQQGALPTGTGDCCAPKLLHYAATHQLRPLALAEFWWGPDSPQGDKRRGEFYGACVDRCQPIMGFLLSGLGLAHDRVSARTLTLLYEDDWLIAVNKPAGLLSVPGRSSDRQDSVLSRLQTTRADGAQIKSMHRLDQETSGILLLARDAETHRQVSQQFQQRSVHKCYEAILAGHLAIAAGVIQLPLGAKRDDRPRQGVDWGRGKPSITQFRVLARTATTTRIEFVPLTGRTHQLRVHAVAGLGVPILGDRLYGDDQAEPNSRLRLHLHARDLEITHPQTGDRLRLQAPTPF
jgi:tRNA pseudouridine32 synthase/23S rRNA pseudouridine746 synthase